jgi:hypothetical protein
MGKNPAMLMGMSLCNTLLVTLRLSRNCVPAQLQASLLHLFAYGRFQLEQFSIPKPRDGPQYSSERNFSVVGVRTFYHGFRQSPGLCLREG